MSEGALFPLAAGELLTLFGASLKEIVLQQGASACVGNLTHSKEVVDRLVTAYENHDTNPYKEYIYFWLKDSRQRLEHIIAEVPREIALALCGSDLLNRFCVVMPHATCGEKRAPSLQQTEFRERYRQQEEKNIIFGPAPSAKAAPKTRTIPTVQHGPRSIYDSAIMRNAIPIVRPVDDDDDRSSKPRSKFATIVAGIKKSFAGESGVETVSSTEPLPHISRVGGAATRRPPSRRMSSFVIESRREDALAFERRASLAMDIGDNLIMLIIVCAERPYSKGVRFPPRTTAAEILRSGCEKMGLDHREYDLLFHNKVVLPNLTVADINFVNRDEVTLRRRPDANM